LTALAQILSACGNANLRAREWKGDLIFLHEVISGAADRSYGVQVAKLAGLPGSAVARAKAILGTLEKGQNGAKPLALDDLPLFARYEPITPEPPPKTALELAIEDLDPNNLSPRDALDFVYALKKLI
jgi:DNA mismatch repair protein MutS